VVGSVDNVAREWFGWRCIKGNVLRPIANKVLS